MMVSAIVLAAGESRRIGKPKLLLPLGESTILGKSIENVAASGVGETIVVLGYAADMIMPMINSTPVKTVINHLYRRGMSTSIIAGVGAVGAKAGAVMLVLADQPFINSRVIDLLLAEFGRRNKGIVVPTYKGQRGHPAIISLRYRDELLALRGDIGAREIISRHLGDVHEVEVDSPGVIFDIDTLKDYRHLQTAISI
jgi:molybdenum cofactor cytidylyltransferase